ncbi:MAG: phage tail tube protein [Peptostreptococcales bacterium]
MSDANRILTGNSGNVWINGKLLTTIKSIELKVTGNFEDVNICGDNATYNRFLGWSGEGTCTWGKVDSTVLKLLADSYKTGDMPEIKIISKLTDKTTKKSERAAVSEVVFTEFFLTKFEAKTMVDEEIPLKFSDYEVLETI